VFALPTAYPVEAQPLTVIEALAAGTPVVVTRQGGLPEMITDGVEGQFVPPRAPEAVAEAVEALTAPGRWAPASTAARARFERAFSPEAVGARWQGALARL
jgi:glycosyltransferase involved in cell wall biosynthesis